MRSWSCGPAALVNAARAIGVRVAEGRLRKLAGTTVDGTDDVQLIAAARAINLTATPHHSADKAAAWAFIRANVLDGRPCLICIDQWTHWVSIIGIVGDRVILSDSSNTKKNTSENGIYSLSRTDLYKRWRCPNEREAFYAIAVGK